MSSEEADRLLYSFVYPDSGETKFCLEIGAGTGFWTAKLAPLFGHVLGLDVVSKSPSYPVRSNVSYVQVPDRNFDLPVVADNTLDFIFSFNTFAYLTREAQRQYLKACYRCLKPGSRAVISFLNWKQHPELKAAAATLNAFVLDAEEVAYFGNGSIAAINVPADYPPLFYNTLAHIQEMAGNWFDFENLIPGHFADFSEDCAGNTLVRLTKPRHE